MKLRTRLLLSIGLTLVCVFVGISQLSNALVMRSFDRLEKAHVERNIERARLAMEQMGAELHVKNADWAKWDESYAFMKGKNPSYVNDNMSDAAIATLKIDALIYIDTSKQEVASKAIKRTDLPAPKTATLIRQLRPRLDQLTHSGVGVHGVLLHEGRPMLVSVYPISRTDGSGDACGWIVFAAHVDGGRVQQLREVTRVEVDVFPAALDSLSQAPVIPVSAKQMVGTTNVADIFGQPALDLRLNLPREIHDQAVATVQLINEMILIVGLILGVVIAFVLEKFALARVSRLTNQVERISARSENGRVRVNGRDELGMLATRINEMLATLAEERQHVVEQRNEIEAKNAVLECAIEGVAKLDSAGKYLNVNSAFARMTGAAGADLVGRSWMADVMSEDHGVLLEGLRRAHDLGRAQMLLRGLREDGAVYFQEATIIPSLDFDGEVTGHHLFVKDVTERRQLEIEIEHQAFHDKLTDLPNRALFLNRMEQALVKARRHGLGTAALFIDLDNFKLVNDSLGHAAGDELLIEVARRLKSCLRPGDTVARLGGDEFTILLEDLGSMEEAEVIARRVLESLKAAVKLSSGEAFASATIGIAFADDPRMTSEELMKNADTTMYHAKAKGKSCYALFDSTMQDWATERMELETSLRKALENGEIYAAYQPLINLRTGEVEGSEALARWSHPERGNVPPGEFIPIAEETGQILTIGYFMLEQACAQTQAWQELSGRSDLMVSVNLSGRQLQQPDVVERVMEVLETTGLRAECLKLEITESVLMDRSDCIDKLRKLREKGIKLALDDFGTGFSSLARLSAFPINTIKIDRAFISRLGQEEHARAVVQAIMALSHSLNMDVTGEGVETDDQLRIIRSMGCETGQGYLFARPLTPEDFASVLEKGHPARDAA